MTKQEELLVMAREIVIQAKADDGLPYWPIVQRGIRSGQWDRGFLVRNALEQLIKDRS